MDSILRDEISALLTDQKDQLFDICSVKMPSERVDAYARLLRDVLRMSSLCYADGSLRYFTGTHYAPVKMEEVVAGVGDILVDMGCSPTDMRRVADMPYSVISERTFPRQQLLCFSNGVLDLTGTRRMADAYDEYLSWSGAKQDHQGAGGSFHPGFSRDWVVTERLPYPYDPEAGCPRWDAFLSEVLPDPDERAVLQEFFGMTYLDRSAFSVEKFALLVGQGANGKSVIFEVVKRALGPDNVSTMDSGQLTDERMIPYLNGKRLNFAPDVRQSAAFTSALKALASGQDVTGRRIYGEAEKVKAPPLCFALNEMPRFMDGTPAFFRRVLLFSFDVVIPPRRQDKRLVEKICRDDLPGIFNWIMEGRRRLEKNKGEFSHCSRMDAALSALRKDVEDDRYPVMRVLERRGLSPRPVFPRQRWDRISRQEIEEALGGRYSPCMVTRMMTQIGAERIHSGDVYFKVYRKDEKQP